MELSQYQPGRLYAREDGGGSRRAEGALYLVAAWLRSKGHRSRPAVAQRNGPSPLSSFVSSSLCLLDSSSLSLFVSLSFPPLLSFFNIHSANTANALKTKDLRKRHF